MDSSSESNSVVQEKVEEESFVWPIPERVVSLPPEPTESKTLIKEKISAPCYFHSLAENDAPPFRKPGKEPQLRLLTGTLVTSNEAIEMIAAHESDPENGLKKFLTDLMVRKDVIANHNLKERDFLVSLLKEVIDYCAQRDFNARKLACMLTIYLAAHKYFKWYYWSSPQAIWGYFKEIMIWHSIQDSPTGEVVYEPEECYDILTHFHSTYMKNLPLIHILTFCSSRLKFVWPFKQK